MVSTITRADGSAQLTYKGMPLYFWKSDVKPGDTTGNGVGGVWSVVKP
jgi:predicted lipoprotein with Yx(FWY)xxD motif